MPDLVYDTPTPPSQLYSSSAAIAGGAGFPASSLRPRFQQQVSQPVVTSTVLPKSRLREQYRPEMDYDLDTSSSDSTFSSTDLAVENNNNHHNDSPRAKHHVGRAAAVAAEADENRAPAGYYRSPGYGDAGMGPGMDDKQRFLDVRQQSKQQQRGSYLSTRVDEHSDATPDSSNQSTASDSEDDIRARFPPRQQPSSHTNKASAPNNLTSTPYPGPGVSSNNISKSAFDGMARELRKEFDRIMHAGKEPVPSNNNTSQAPPLPSNPSPPQFRNRRNSAARQEPTFTSPSYVQDNPAPLPRGVLPRRPSSANATARPANRDHERTPTTQRTFGQEIRFPRQQESPARPPQYNTTRPSPPKPILAQPKPSWQTYEPTSPFHAAPSIVRPGTIPPNNTRASNPSPYRAADSPGRVSNASSSSYPALRVPDVTGLTEGLTSPSRVESGPSSHRNFATASGSPVSSGRTFRTTQEDPALASALSGLRRRLEALESENARSEAKVAELQDKLASRDTAGQQSAGVIEGTNPAEFVQSLRGEITKLQAQIEMHNHTLSQLQAQQPQATNPGAFAEYNPNSWQNVFASLRDALHQLADQVMQVRRVLEEVLESMRNAPQHVPGNYNLFGQQTHLGPETIAPAPHSHIQQQYPVSLSRQPGINPPLQTFQQPIAKQSTRLSPPLRSSSEPISQGYNAEYRVPRTASNPLASRGANDALLEREPLLDRAERILSSLPPRSNTHAPATCDTCLRQINSGAGGYGPFANHDGLDDSHPARQRHSAEQELPMQTVVVRALRELEEDFAVHRRIYIDLSEEFKKMDPATPEVSRRKILASHLKESIDVLEMKADEIKRLHDLLHYRSELQTSSENERMRNMAKAGKARFAL